MGWPKCRGKGEGGVKYKILFLSSSLASLTDGKFVGGVTGETHSPCREKELDFIIFQLRQENAQIEIAERKGKKYPTKV